MRLLQMIAGITVNNGHQFTPGQFLAMGQQRGLDAASKSAITGFITKEMILEQWNLPLQGAAGAAVQV